MCGSLNEVVLLTILAQALRTQRTKHPFVSNQTSMGKRFEKVNTHSNKALHHRLKRVAITTEFLLRELLGQDTNPNNLTEPQPLSKLDVIEYLHNVISGKESNGPANELHQTSGPGTK